MYIVEFTNRSNPQVGITFSNVRARRNSVIVTSELLYFEFIKDIYVLIN